VGLAAFSPQPAVLAAPLPGPGPPVAGSGAERAQAAAMADRLLSQVRFGRVGEHGHVVHMQLGEASIFGGLRVQLTHEDGGLSACIVAPAGHGPLADELQRALDRELRRRGLEVRELRVESE
jgi:hypothetical protein